MTGNQENPCVTQENPCVVLLTKVNSPDTPAWNFPQAVTVRIQFGQKLRRLLRRRRLKGGNDRRGESEVHPIDNGRLNGYPGKFYDWAAPTRNLGMLDHG